MSQHTPGPWAVERDGYTLTMRDQVVATGLAPDGAPATEQRANARLITAAPELLAWLTKAAQMADQQHRGGENIPMASAWRWLADNAQAAIAKATEEPS